MRIGPLGVWGHTQEPDDLAHRARLDSALTHPNPICQEACAAFVVAIASAVARGGDGPAVYRDTLGWAERGTREKAVLEALRSAAETPPTDYVSQAGWVMVAFQNAFYQLLHAPSLEEGVVRTVMSGGDTDTNAAIAGALLGAVCGREAVPRQWQQMVLTCRPLKGEPGVRHPRPQPFWPVDLLEIAESLLIAGAGTFTDDEQ